MNGLYGYRCTEVKLPDVELLKTSASIKVNQAFKDFHPVFDKRRLVRVSLGCHVWGAANPVPDLTDPETSLEGIKKRFLRAPPVANAKIVRRFKVFVKKWLKANIRPLDVDTDFSFENWIQNTPYPQWRKEQLIMEYSNIEDEWDSKHSIVKSFIKDECYPSYKHSRGINSRSDAFKCIVGPIFKQIEKVLFDPDRCPWFIKKIPVDERAEYIFDRLFRPGVTYFTSDYTAFESLFTLDIMTACEFQLYDHMLSRTPEHKAFMMRCMDVLGGTNICKFKWFTARCEATRMSGEMNTSLGNGFSNLMFMLFMCEEMGCRDVVGVVEGDDGLFAFTGPAPSKERFAELGLNIKLEIHTELNTASFCGLIFDLEEKMNVTNPIDALLDFGWTTREYAGAGKRMTLELLKAKSLSMAYAYAGCPILSSLAKYGLRVTQGVRVGRILNSRKISQWERDQLLEALTRKHKVLETKVGFRTRVLVEEQFGISVEDQIALEKYLDSLEVLQPLDVPNVDLFCNVNCVDFFEKYGVNVDDVNKDLGINLPRSNLKLHKQLTTR